MHLDPHPSYVSGKSPSKRKRDKEQGAKNVRHDVSDLQNDNELLLLLLKMGQRKD